MKKYFFIWLIFIFTLTSIPQNNLLSTPKFHSFIYHFFFYSTLSIFFLAGFKKDKLKMLLTIALIAAIDELHQFFIPGRRPSIIDFLFDLGGGIFVCLSV